NDVYFVDSAGDAVIENANEGIDEIRTGLASYSIAALPNVENLTGTSGAAQSLTGNRGDNVITGNTGNDTLSGGGGSDALSGGAGADTMTGGTGNDVYFVDNPGDVVMENANEGMDTVYASTHYQLTANVENLTLQGGTDLQAYGNALVNVITGNNGNNVLDGGAGGDLLSGGMGDDVYFVDDAGDF